MFHDMRQWWHGRAVPMAGVGGVKVAPEQRGRGTGRALMTEVLRVIADRGYPLSVLYPATAPLYRSLGWELAGGLYRGLIRRLARSPRCCRRTAPRSRCRACRACGGQSPATPMR